MDSSEELRSSFDSFKSKKILHSSSKSLSSEQPVKALVQSQWSSKTPEKSLNPPRRLRNRGAALSLKQVRQCAKRLQTRDPSDRPDPLSSPNVQISSEPSQSSVDKPKRSVMLPEQYETLDKLFSSLDSSIRLLCIKGTMSTFTNICPKMECLTDRRFSHGHLAQLKFILPEAIEIEKVLIRDERTSCMKPDLHVTLNASAIESDEKLKSSSGNLPLRKIFRARLFDFAESHPEGHEVPEATLPEPFNKTKQEPNTNTIHASTFCLTNDKSVLPAHKPASASHLSQSFRRGFSKRALSGEAVSKSQLQSATLGQTTSLSISENCTDQRLSEKEASTSVNLPLRSASKGLASGSPPVCQPSSCLLATPVKGLALTKNEASSKVSDSIQRTPAKSLSTPAKSFSTPVNLTSNTRTPAKLLSTPAKPMSATPMLQPPKRCYMTPDTDSTSSPNKLVRRPQCSRSLKFDTPIKEKHVKGVSESEDLLAGTDIFDILPENLLHSIREKEKKALEDQDPAISQAKRRQKMIASLPKLFDMVHFFFQSIKRSTVTKDELIHKIIASLLDIVDRGEIEEQLRLLQELAPEWIYEKLASTGDIFLCINKISSPESIRTRLAEAK